MLKKILLTALAIIVVAAAAGALMRDRLVEAAMRKQIMRNLSGEAFREMNDGLNVVLCGAGSPLPDPTRSGPCVLVIAGTRVMVVDVGSGAVRRIGPAGVPMARIEDVFLTHFHSDHIDGLGELMMQRWAGASRTSPLPVHGPTGVEDVVAGFNQAYMHDDHYRVAHHGEKIIPPSGAGGIAMPFELPAEGQGTVVLDTDGLKVTAFAVDHRPIVPAVGYRFDYQGRSVVISGDTVKSANLQHFAQGADLLVHEALNPDLLKIMTNAAVDAGAANLAQITRDIVNYHTTPVQAAEIARDAGVKHLLFYHLVPALPYRPMEQMFVRGVSGIYKGGVTVGHDGTWISLPANSSDVRVGSRF
ncbi:MAG TPA: MBL fold metallo-hydrolase [Nevskiaceae bacterium]|nr:MBL fold metallo-hydrolase [Nevskiaceae bacterium]